MSTNTQTNSFDLSTLNVSDAAEKATPMVVKHPDQQRDEPLTFVNTEGKKQNVTISFLGKDSEVARKIQRKFQQKRLDKLSKGKRLQLSPDQLDQETVELLTALCRGWEGISWKGEIKEFTPENVRWLFTEPGLTWIREQAEEFIGDLNNFLGN